MNNVKKILNIAFRILDIFQKSAVFISAVGFCLICFAQVVARYCFNNSIVWADQACRYLFCVSTFLGSALCVKDRKHTSIDILAEFLSERGKKIQNISIHAIIAVFGIVLCKSGYKLAKKAMRQKVTTLPLKMGMIYMMVPVSAVLITINALRVIMEDIEAYKALKKADGKEASV